MGETISNLKKETMSGLFWKFSERIIAQGVSLIVSIILARLLTPEDYGVVSIVAIFFSFANVFISSGFNTALMQKKDADIEDYSSVLWISLISASLIYFILFFFAPVLANLYGQEILILVIRIMGLTLFINAIKSVICAYISSHLQFKSFFWATLVGTICSAVIGISMAVNGSGCWALVAQQMSNAIIDTAILYCITRIRFVLKISKDKTKKLFKYGWKILAASELSVLYEEVNPLIIGLKYSNADLAFYSKGKSFPNLLNSTLTDTLSAVLFPIMSKIQENKSTLLDYTRKFMSLSSFIIFPVMIGFLAVAENFIIVILTEKWLPATIYIQAFCIVYMFNIIQVGNLQVIRAIGRSDLILLLEIIKKSSYFIVILLFVLFTDDPRFLALACIINTGIASLVNTAPNRKLICYRYRSQVLDLSLNFITSLMMGCLVYFVGFLDINIYLLLPMQIFIGVISYLLFNIIFKNANLKYGWKILQQTLRKLRKKHASD